MSAQPTNRGSSAAKTILLAGFVAGVMDIVAAIISYYIRTQKEPTRLFQFIASGVFGKEAFTGGTTMAIIGLLFHFMLAYVFAIAFYLIYPKIKLLSRNTIITGLVYGVIVWVIMNLVVLPLSNAPKLPFNPKQAAIGMAILMVCIGLPISLIVHKHYRRNAAY
jgi:uncharacterized membrane protein YagU involved in acid resistance